jgi:hypothetical protein
VAPDGGEHPLYRWLVAAAEGAFPPVDGGVTIAAPSPCGHHAVVEFSGHAVVLTQRTSREVVERGADGFGGASHPDVISWLAGPGGWIGSQDAVLVARGTGTRALPERDDLDDHPRVVRSRRHRRDVRVFGDDDGVVTIGRGLVDRTEISVEVFRPGRGHGGRLIAAGRGLVPAGSLVWAQVAPGNAASLRAFLRAGFVPIGAETLIVPHRLDGDLAQ